MITSNTREDLERDNARLQKENWEYKKVGCSNTDHNSLYVQLETSNNENQRLQQEIHKINHNVEKLMLDNKTNVDNYNNKMDLLLNKIESLVRVNDSANIKIENLNQQNMKNVENSNKKIEMLSDKINSLEKENQSLHQLLKQQLASLESKLNEEHLGINDKVSKELDLLFLKSSIIEYSSFKIINDWIDDGKTMDFELLYKASGDDFSIPSFHLACDCKGPTITLIETTDGDVFGGYNSQSWNSDSIQYGDDKCFLFTLVNKHGIKPTKYLPNLIHQTYVAGFPFGGPMFGSGYDKESGSIDWDIVIGPCGSYQSFPRTYIDTTGKGKSTLTPTSSFTIKTIEIHKCVFILININSLLLYKRYKD
ncbi:hypothetical protein CYY_007256 [Polysphondylium violaceum]|uniref:TLDc domain-containing protein n=1 Tax=Polysphondylium violaceum TaxID=133409 RepID=A0A8J4V2E1_9MYCE|nr:hypothetical protein CYY_007256 [Polysphondylium violaceum]